MDVNTSFEPMAERYKWDFETCTYENGWFQVDTYQDASYFGIWTNPTTRQTITYCEGDVTETRCDTDAEYAQALRETLCYYKNDVWPHAKIDLGWPGPKRLARSERFAELGCAGYTH